MPRARRGRPVQIADSRSAAALLAPAFIDLSREELYVLHLDARFTLLRLSRVAVGNAETIQIPIRRVITEALEVETRALVLAHNHPGGDPTPSPADRRTTRRLADVARALDIRIVDHLVFAVPRWVSFRAMGLL